MRYAMVYLTFCLCTHSAPGQIDSRIPAGPGEVRINAKDGLRYVWIPAGNFLMGCALPLDGLATRCGQCSLRPPPWSLVQSGLRYAFPVDRLLPRFKFHGDLAAGEVLATLLQWSLDPAETPEALVPVPLHRARLRERGYDQALELARFLQRDGGPPVLADRLRRLRHTAPQSELGAAARRDNVFGAFALHGDGPLPAHVALVDDVLTTGATVGECARVLLSAGVRRVDVWTVARAL